MGVFVVQNGTIVELPQSYGGPSADLALVPRFSAPRPLLYVWYPDIRKDSLVLRSQETGEMIAFRAWVDVKGVLQVALRADLAPGLYSLLQENQVLEREHFPHWSFIVDDSPGKTSTTADARKTVNPTLTTITIAIPTVTETSACTATPIWTSSPSATKTATPSSTRIATRTPTPAPDAVITHSILALRSGPGDEYATLANHPQGTAVGLTGQSADGEWVQVRTTDGRTGWMWAAYLRISVSLEGIPVAETPSDASCRYGVDSAFSALQTGELGCPLSEAKVIWSAIQAFEGGYMLWRSDVNQVTVFYNSGLQETLPDQWHGESYITGSPPAGRVAPERGFGWLWATKLQMREELGWGLELEKGFCARVQYFGHGFALRSVTGSCGNEFNRANEGDFAPVFLVAEDSGGWNKSTGQLPAVTASSTPPPRPTMTPTVAAVLLDNFDSYPSQDILRSAYHINAAWGQNQASLSLVPAQAAGSEPNCLMFEYDILQPAPDNYAGF